jgi:pimeloyl-ACP methyl ester carboxylesterase
MTPGTPTIAGIPTIDTAMKSVELPQGTVLYRDVGEGEPLVFMHGLLMNGTIWDPVIAGLQAQYRCIVPELPLGSHTVPLNPRADCSPLGVAKLVAGFLEELELEAVTLIGNDSGGAIAQMVAAHHPQRLGRLVLTPCDAYENFLPPLFRYLQWTARVPGMPSLLVQSMRIPGVRRLPIAYGWLAKKRLDSSLLDTWLAPPMGNPGIRRDLTHLLRRISSKDSVAAAQQLRSTKLPTLIVWAPEDRFFKLKYGERLANDIPGAKLVQIEDSYTLVCLDQPQRTIELIADFLQGTPAVSRPVREAVE